MIDFVHDDGGRAASGRHGYAGDCTVRALAIISGRPYKQCYVALAKANSRSKWGSGRRSARDGVFNDAYTKVFAEFGLVKMKQGRSGPRLTWTEAWKTYGDCIVCTMGHVAALKGGALRDTKDCRAYMWQPTTQSIPEQRERKALSIWRLA